MPSYTRNTISDGRKTIAAAGTAEKLAAASTPAVSVEIRALDANTKPVAVGSSTVKAKAAEARGRLLKAGESVKLEGPLNLNSLFVDAEVNGEGVSYLAVASE